MRRSGDGFALQVPRFDELTGHELPPETQGADLHALQIELERLRTQVADLEALIDDIEEIERNDPTKEQHREEWLVIRPKGDGDDRK